MKKTARLCVALALLGASVCAHAGLFSDDEARAQIDVVKQQLADLQQQISQLNQRLTTEETASKGQLLDLLSKLQAQQGLIEQLQGQNEVLSATLDNVQKQQKQLYQDLDGRVKTLEKAAAPQPNAAAPAATGDTSATGDASATPAAPVADADLNAWQNAFAQVKSGDYQGAAKALQAFLRQYPGSRYAPSAQYWLGSCQFALQDYKAALASQKRLVELWPTSPKVPDAELNIASILLARGEMKSARATLRELIRKYPSSPAATTARKRLRQLH